MKSQLFKPLVLAALIVIVYVSFPRKPTDKAIADGHWLVCGGEPVFGDTFGAAHKTVVGETVYRDGKPWAMIVQRQSSNIFDSGRIVLKAMTSNASGIYCFKGF